MPRAPWYPSPSPSFTPMLPRSPARSAWWSAWYFAASIVCGQRVAPLPAQLGDLGGELRVHVAPFAQAQIRNELCAARVDQLAVRELLGELRLEELPQREQRQEIRSLVAKDEVRLVGRLLLGERTLARVRHRQRGGDDQHFGDAALLARRDDHSRDARIDGEPRELGARAASAARAPSTAPSSCSSW